MVVSRAVIADLTLVAVTVLAAFGWVFSRESLTALAPMLFLTIRFFASALVVGCLDLGRLRALNRGQWRRAWVTGSLLGLQTTVWVMGLFYAEHMGVGAFLVSLGAVLVPVVGRLGFQLRTHIHTWLAMLVALAGLALLLLGKNFNLQVSDWYFLATALLFAIYFNVNGRYANRIPAVPLTAIQMVAAGVVTGIASLWREPISLQGLPSVLGWVLAAIFIATALRFFLLVKAQSLAPQAHAAVIMTLEPMWVVLLGTLWFGESMNELQIAGCGLIFLSLLANAVGGALLRRRQRLLNIAG